MHRVGAIQIDENNFGHHNYRKAKKYIQNMGTTEKTDNIDLIFQWLIIRSKYTQKIRLIYFNHSLELLFIINTTLSKD